MNNLQYTRVFKCILKNVVLKNFIAICCNNLIYDQSNNSCGYNKTIIVKYCLIIWFSVDEENLMDEWYFGQRKLHVSKNNNNKFV